MLNLLGQMKDIKVMRDSNDLPAERYGREVIGSSTSLLPYPTMYEPIGNVFSPTQQILNWG